MKFNWPLQRYKNVVDKRESMLIADMLRISNLIAQKHQEIARLRQTIKGFLSDLSSQSIDRRMSQHAVVFAALRSEEDNIKSIQAAVKELQLSRDKIQNDLFELRKTQKMLGKLREKAKLKFDQAYEKKQQSEMEELFQLKFARQKFTVA